MPMSMFQAHEHEQEPELENEHDPVHGHIRKKFLYIEHRIV